MKFEAAFEVNKHDIWIGASWKKSNDIISTGAPSFEHPIYERLDILVGFAPCVQVHLAFWWGAST